MHQIVPNISDLNGYLSCFNCLANVFFCCPKLCVGVVHLCVLHVFLVCFLKLQDEHMLHTCWTVQFVCVVRTMSLLVSAHMVQACFIELYGSAHGGVKHLPSPIEAIAANEREW